VVAFAAGSSTGEDNNILNNNDIGHTGAGGVSNGIYSGSGAATTDHVQITNNRIFDIRGSVPHGIKVDTGNSDWTISGNSIYQTAPLPYGPTFIGIQILDGNGYSVVNNAVGGTAPNAGGSPMQVSSAFTGLDLTVGTATPTSVQGNTIKNIRMSFVSFVGPSYGIFLGAGAANIGNLAGNTIGAIDPNQRIETFYDLEGIRVNSTSDVNVSNNVINNMTLIVSPLHGPHITGISLFGNSGNHTITNNIITNVTNSGSANGSLLSPRTTGLSIAASGVHTVRGNKISNIGSTNTADIFPPN